MFLLIDYILGVQLEHSTNNTKYLKLLFFSDVSLISFFVPYFCNICNSLVTLLSSERQYFMNNKQKDTSLNYDESFFHKTTQGLFILFIINSKCVTMPQHMDHAIHHGRPQAWARGGTCPPLAHACGHLPPSGYIKCFCALVVTAKRSVDELFMHYFHNLSSASGASPPDLPGV